MSKRWDRRLIPRWRDSRISASLPESKPLSTVARPSAGSFLSTSVVESLLLDWRADRSMGGAADLLNFGHIPTALPFLREPAEYLASLNDGVPLPLRQFALRILDGRGGVSFLSATGGTVDRKARYRSKISELKQKLLTNPRDAIALVDIARIYAALGQNEKALKSILVAVALCPNHRFILRSATRFLVHAGKSDRALHLLSSTPRTREDPWLLASHISVSTLLAKPQKHIRLARQMVQSDRLSPSHTCELAGSLATIQLLSGSNREAKRSFNASLIHPNDNTVAQAMWAADEFNISIQAREEWFDNHFTFEGRYYQRRAEADFEGAMEASIQWFDDEPFSSRPMKAAAFSSAMLGLYSQSESYAREGLLLDRQDIELNNNLVCALAAQNKIDEAFKYLIDVIQIERTTLNAVSGHTLANCGLILYRTGYFDEAENYYRRAIESFSSRNNLNAKGVAAAFMAREASLAKAPNATYLLAEAIDILKQTGTKDGRKVIESFDPSAVSREKKNQSEIELLPKWSYDKLRNILTVKKELPFKVR